MCAGRPPELSSENVSRIVCKLFQFSAVLVDSIKIFPSYEDRNYFFVGRSVDGDGENVLTLSNPKGILVDELQGINHLMNYLKSCGLTLSYPLTASNGEDIVFLSHSELIEEEQPKKFSRVACANYAAEYNEQYMQDARTAPSELVYYIRVLQFVLGTILHDVDRSYFVPSLLYSIGLHLAKMDKALMVWIFVNKNILLCFISSHILALYGICTYHQF